LKGSTKSEHAAMNKLLLVAPGSSKFAERLTNLPPGTELAVADTAAEALGYAADASVLIGLPRSITQELIDAMPNLEWLQLMTSGADLIARLRLPEHVVISTARGIHGPQIAELVFFYMLSLLRDTRGVLARQRAKCWQATPQLLLFGSHIVIVGVGSISEALAQRCSSFGMHVTGVSSSRIQAPGFEELRPMTSLHDTVRTADFVVILTPYCPATHRLIDDTLLTSMPNHAILINVARGPVVDEAALIDALEHGTIGGAGLDVFEHEPLPAGNPLWYMNNVIITPHIGGFSNKLPEQFAPLFRENIVRWFATPRRPLRNQIRLTGCDKQKTTFKYD